MSDQSSLLVEKLWQLKRRIDKGECPDIAFVHLNNLLREPGYRSDVLRRVESSGSGQTAKKHRACYFVKAAVDPDFQTRVQMRQMKATQPPKSEFFDESANYAGALNPRLQSSWLEGWTAFPEG